MDLIRDLRYIRTQPCQAQAYQPPPAPAPDDQRAFPAPPFHRMRRGPTVFQESPPGGWTNVNSLTKTNEATENMRIIRYEDFSLDPYKGSEGLFKFLGINFGPEVKRFLDTHTKSNAGGVSSTFRNSKSAPFHWRMDLSFSEVQNIQRKCSSAMDLWGYTKAHNASHQKIFDPIKKKYSLKP